MRTSLQTVKLSGKKMELVWDHRQKFTLRKTRGSVG